MADVPKIRVKDFARAENMFTSHVPALVPTVDKPPENNYVIMTQNAVATPAGTQPVVLCPANIFFALLPKDAPIVNSGPPPLINNNQAIINVTEQNSGNSVKEVALKQIRQLALRPIKPKDGPKTTPFQRPMPIQPTVRLDARRTYQRPILHKNSPAKSNNSYVCMQGHVLKKCQVRLADFMKYPEELKKAIKTKNCVDVMKSLTAKLKTLITLKCCKCKGIWKSDDFWINVETHEIVCQVCIAPKKAHTSMTDFLRQCHQTFSELLSDDDDDETKDLLNQFSKRAKR